MRIFLGYKLVTSNLNSLVESILIESIIKNKKSWLACLNPHSYVIAKCDSLFRASLSSATWLVPDGIGIVWGARILKLKLRERITGPDVFFSLNSKANELGGISVFFIGSNNECLKEIKKRFKLDYPDLIFSGYYSPPYREIFSAKDLNKMLRAVNKASPQILWVGMTAPKQEKWICANLHLLEVSFAGAIGAVFDFYAGRVKRPHPIFQRLGLEWFGRLIKEPRRLWRRTFISSPLFFLEVISSKIRNIL